MPEKELAELGGWWDPHGPLPGSTRPRLQEGSGAQDYDTGEGLVAGRSSATTSKRASGSL